MFDRIAARLAPLIVAVVVFSSGSWAAEGYTIFHIGNSLMDETYGVNDAAVSNGYTGVEWGRFMIPGAPIHLLWSDRNTGGGFRRPLGPVTEHGWALPDLTVGIDQYLRSTPVDVLVMQIFPGNGDSYVNRWSQPSLNSGTIDGVVGFSGAVYEGNPDARVFLYASHTMDEGAIDDVMDDEIVNYKALKDTLDNAYPDRNPAWIIPAPLAFNKMITDGYDNLWKEGDGHANDNGRYLLAMLFYCCIYQEDCAGSEPSGTAVAGALPSVSADFAAKAQEVAWEIAQSYQYSGVDSQGGTGTVRRRSSVRRGGDSPVIYVNLRGRQVLSAPGLPPCPLAARNQNKGRAVLRTSVR